MRWDQLDRFERLNLLTHSKEIMHATKKKLSVLCGRLTNGFEKKKSESSKCCTEIYIVSSSITSQRSLSKTMYHSTSYWWNHLLESS
jgi:hypothetical protein